jgi:hypothetical protein
VADGVRNLDKALATISEHWQPPGRHQHQD